MLSSSNVMSPFRPSSHRIQHGGVGYSRPLTDEELVRSAPAIFAADAHFSRSERYAHIPTLSLVTEMRKEGFFPVKVQQARSRIEDKKGFGKHLIRFRREDQLAENEAREVVLVNSHDGSSSFKLMAGVFRLVCTNGLIVGQTDSEIRVHHSGDAMGQVIEGACRVVDDFDRVTASIEAMKEVTLSPDQQQAFARAALALRFDDPENCGIRPDQLIRARRKEDTAPRLWETFNVVQENIIRGGLRGVKINAEGRRALTRTREVKGIDQSVALNRGLWVLADEMAKLAA
ncbi:MAG: DUF932 domain-containing protein [Halothiobacillaceae bacterium]|nr:DUF932 domain-containing protein [Halothiobacillaceae bacterium]